MGEGARSGGLGLALLLNEKLRGLRLWRTLLILPLMTPPVVGSLLWKVIMRPTGGGILNHILISMGLPMQGFLGDTHKPIDGKYYGNLADDLGY